MQPTPKVSSVNLVGESKSISIENLTAFFTLNPKALDMVSFDFTQEPEPCRVSTCESMAEFFVFEPITNEEVAHVCMSCFEQATKGAATGTVAYYSRFEAIMGEEQTIHDQDFNAF